MKFKVLLLNLPATWEFNGPRYKPVGCLKRIQGSNPCLHFTAKCADGLYFTTRDCYWDIIQA